ncbi:Phosphoadenosine phosphosulfate reductase family protein [Natronincola peptidivorans]|uniref:Phosphoadenosine phosphosulfate reductase family protein n=1 Tax=Natronincola peptidivorans TaxID=426128 RepID=A0A1I0FEZ3_9FIRM|nr:phosphoadenosine phosphosulfate reductase family protein [Natronincola peptidivorans]SET56107.1 Phosphoadenosine phosphosulfate reductase family protein [Natronincola peptidivorans]
MIVSWFSAGVSSFISAYLEKDNLDKMLYIHINDQHEDSIRFLKDCEKALGFEIKILQSRYKSVREVIQQFRYINGAYGAKCTEILKKRVRKEWEHDKKDLTYIWGYDVGERHRAERLLETMPQFQHKFPLIERNLTKEDCHGMLRELGIKRPIMYDLGYRNNNCIGCVKGGMGYWNNIRKDFSEVFEERAKQERVIGHSCIKGIFLDELDPYRGKLEDEVMEECSILCQLNI